MASDISRHAALNNCWDGWWLFAERHLWRVRLFIFKNRFWDSSLYFCKGNLIVLVCLDSTRLKSCPFHLFCSANEEWRIFSFSQFRLSSFSFENWPLFTLWHSQPFVYKHVAFLSLAFLCILHLHLWKATIFVFDLLFKSSQNRLLVSVFSSPEERASPPQLWLTVLDVVYLPTTSKGKFSVVPVVLKLLIDISCALLSKNLPFNRHFTNYLIDLLFNYMLHVTCFLL